MSARWSIEETGWQTEGANQYAPIAIIGEGVNEYEDGPARVVAKIVGHRVRAPGQMSPSHQFMDDARLMAAAPDLLAALRGLYDMGAPDGINLTADEMRDRYAAARAAIAKAEAVR
jgi:hypothetical protein